MEPDCICVGCPLMNFDYMPESDNKLVQNDGNSNALNYE